MLNQLEPYELIDLFVKFPPYDFKARKNNKGVILFDTLFDILTTADDFLAKKLKVFENLPILKGFFKPLATFVGTTVSEYLVLPELDEIQFIDSIIEGWDTEYLIVKDIPKDSPLLSKQENAYSDNLVKLLDKRGFVILTGQALAYKLIDFKSIDEYLMRFSYKRRYDFRRKLKKKAQLILEIEDSGNFDNNRLSEYYSMYESVYNKSYIHFDKLTPDFFRELLRSKTLGAKIFSYYIKDKNELIGYKICFQGRDYLIDKFAGFKYPEALNFNVYFISWFDNLEYCINNKLKKFIIGWTNPETKAYLGADFNFTLHAVYPRNPLIRRSLRYLSRFFESDKNELERFLRKK
ncbi:Peptidogalycan biosysnthesis/recognition [Thermodesulfobium acidiphilum]|uniref:Peptidogalycan biosysnthesis/recognition n=1 Tax=Thermodesulfobium acidiphilum TaxID=1794699 RepID=A0A2R4VYD2_THEAF|nr:GNAT family N-acetyltransferase [Thermodesulfobium acidiphilum]AWB09537.1 Peptidogalycan biosysnthesis/recognition [Thermodesulfobium acidiphilum]